MIARPQNPPDRQRRYDLRNCELIVLNQKELSPQSEMVENIRAILHCFSSLLYGLRKYKTQALERPRTMQRAFKTKLKLNNKQKTLMAQHAGYSRWVWNWALAMWNEA